MERQQGQVGLVLVLLALAHFAAVTAAPNYNLMGGGSGMGLYFDGDDAQTASVILSNHLMSDNNEVTQYTIEFWVQLRDPYQDEHAVLTYSAYDSTRAPFIAAPTEIGISFNTKLNQIMITSRANRDVCGRSTCPALADVSSLQEWNHLALTWESVQGVDLSTGANTYTYTKRLYHNGEEVYSVENSVTTQGYLIPNGLLAFGQQPGYFLGGYNELRALTGTLDEFRVWVGARSAEAIKANYAKQINPTTESRLIIYYHFDEPDENDMPYNRESWSRFIPTATNYGSGGKALDLLIGRSATSENVLVFETDRPSVRPNRPRYVFTDVPLTSPGGSQHFKIQARSSDGLWTFDEVIIPLVYDLDNVADLLGSYEEEPLLYILNPYENSGTTKANPLYTVAANPGLTATGLDSSGTLFQMRFDGTRADGAGISLDTSQLSFGVGGITRPGIQVSNQSKYPTRPDGTEVRETWCGKAWGECPYAVIFRPLDQQWRSKKMIHEQFKWVAYAPTSPEYADYTIHGRDFGDRTTTPVKVNIYTDYSTYGWTFSGPPAQLPEREVTVMEDTLTVVHHSDVNDFGSYHHCRLFTLPTLGNLYMLSFKEGMPEVYSNFETDVSKLEEITTRDMPYLIKNDRCSVIYKPPANLAMAFVDAWSFLYEDRTGLPEGASDDDIGAQSGVAGVVVSIESLNDAPNEVPADAKREICFESIDSGDYCVVRMDESVVGSTMSIKLNASDVDNSPVQTPYWKDRRTFFTIKKFPVLGTLYQQLNEYGDIGLEVPQAPVLVATGSAFEVLNGSSQRTLCGTPCEKPYNCPASCAYDDFHLSNLAGDPQDRYFAGKAAFFSEQDLFPFSYFPDYVEMSIHPGDGTQMFLDSVEIFERENPGSVTRIAVAKEFEGVNTKWRTIGSYEPDPSAPGMYPNGRTWKPDICPIPASVAYVRMETVRWTGQSPFEEDREKSGIKLQPPSFDGMRFVGNMGIPPGMVTYESFSNDFEPMIRDFGRVIYKPMRGIHSSGTIFDRFSYSASDCTSESAEPMEVVMTLSGPVKPEDYCKQPPGLQYIKWPGGYNNASCIAEWMDYAATFGHYMAPEFARNASNPLQAWAETFVQPDVTQIVEIPVVAATSELFQKYGVNQSTVCQMIEDNIDPYVSVYLFGHKGKKDSTKFFPLNTRRDGTVYPYTSDELLPNGIRIDSEVKDRYGFDCGPNSSVAGGNAFFDFNTKFGFGMEMVSKEQGRVPFFVDSWIEVQPTREVASFYVVRVRQKILHMCNMNLTHVHYLNRTWDDELFETHGVIVPRALYNASGNCDDCFCNSTHAEPCNAQPMYHDEEQFCVPCHMLSDEHIARIKEDPYETMHLKRVCAILFTNCESGHFFDKDKFRRTGSLSLACTPCAPGRHKSVSSRDETCDPCPLGTYFPVEGAANCIHCREFPEPGFSSFVGASECTRCPRVCERFDNFGNCQVYEGYTVQLNTSNAEAGLYLTDCVCKPGFFHSLQRVGEVCEPCVEGGYCEGGTTLPVPCGESVFGNETLKGLTSDWEWQCEVDDAGYWGAEGQITFFNCEGNHCLGGMGLKCKDGYTNRLCSVCDEGYFAIGSNGCYECPQGRFSPASSLLMVVGLAMVVTGWYVLGVVVSGGYDSIDILMLYMQLLALINRFTINWPTVANDNLSNAHKAMHMVFDLVNFDVDFLKPQCIMDWSYQHSFYLQLMFPVIMAMVAFSRYLHCFLSTKVYFKNVSYQTRNKSWYKTFIHPLDFSTDEDTLKHLLDSSVASFLQFAVMNFNILCEKSFEVFVCSDQGDGSQFMSAGPEITCWSPEHYTMVFFASMSLVVNVLGIPSLLYALIKWAEHNDILNQRRFINAFGWVYMRYENDYNTWEIVLLMRRLVLCICTVFLAGTPYMQTSFAIVAMTLAMGGHFFTRPFRLTSLDVLESIALVQTILYLVCGILFESQPRFSVAEYIDLVDRDTLSIVALFSCLFVIALGILMAFQEIHDVRDTAIAMSVIEERLVEALEGVGLAYQLLGQNDKGEDNTGVLTPETFMLRIRALHPTLTDEACMDLYYAIDTDNSGTVDITEFRNELWAHRRKALKSLATMDHSMFARIRRTWHGIESDFKYSLKNAIAPIKRRFLKSEAAQHLPKTVLKEVRIRMKDRLLKQVKKLNIMLCGDMANVFRGNQLRFFIENTLSDKAIIRYHQVDQWMSAAVADDSEIGIYASNNLMDFFRPLIEALPFLVDWLTTSSEADRFHFRKVFESMFKCYEMIGIKGHYSRYILHDYRPSVAIWLKDCTEEQQVVFWEMMHALTACNTMTEDEADKVAILRPYSLDHEDDRFGSGADPNAKESELKVHYSGKAGMAFEFEPAGEHLSNIKLNTPEAPQGMNAAVFQDVKIVGEPKVGKLLVAAGEMPQGVSRCKFQWFRVRAKPDGSTAMEKINVPNTPHYSVTRADVGCKLRMVVRPYFADGKAGRVSTAITALECSVD